MAEPATPFFAGARIADIRKTAPHAPEPYRSDTLFLLGVIDQLTSLLQQARTEAATAIGGAA